MPDKNFWHSIKQKLESLEFPSENSDWDLFTSKFDPSLDPTFRSSLQDLSTPYVEEDWEQLAQQLDEAPLVDPLFSEIKTKLEAHQLPLEADAWKKFEETTDIPLCPSQASFGPPTEASVPILSMEIPSMDALIRQKLESLSFSPHVTDWYDMLEQLEKDFDTRIKDSLESYQLSEQKKDWAKMSLILDKIYQPVRSFPWMRLAAALIFLIFLLGGNYWMQRNEITFTPSDWLVQKTTPSRLSPVPGSGSKSKPDFRDTQSNKENGEKLIASVDSAALSLPIQEEKVPVQRSTIAALGKSDLAPIQIVDSDKLIAQSALVQDREEKEERLEENMDNEAYLPPRNAGMSVSKMGLLAMNELWEMQDKGRDWQLFREKKQRDIWIGVYGGNTRTRAELSGPKSKIGYTAGVRALVQLNERWSLVTGMAYGQKNFLYTFRDGVNFDSVALKGSLQMVDLPLMLRYEFATEDELKLFLQAGALTSLSLNETYEKYDPNTPANAGFRAASPLGFQPTTLEQRLNTYPGNIWLSFGIAYPISKRLKMEIEPYFLQNLQRTGGVESYGIKKRFYTTGVTLGFYFNANPSKK